MQCNTTNPSVRIANTRSSNPISAGSSNLRCYNCNEIGHARNNCKKPIGRPGKQLLIEGEPSEKEQEPVYDETGNEEDDSLLFGESGEALVIRKSLLAPEKEEKED